MVDPSRPTDRLRILGIDPGSRITGYGVVDKVGDVFKFVSCGAIKVSAKASFPARLQEIYRGISEVIETLQPDVASIEDIFVAVNPRSALKLGHARGVLILAAMEHGLPVHEYTARVIKQAVAGYGQASKSQVQQMVRALLQLSGPPSEDAADGLAAALCHANHCNSMQGIVS
ncbi:MAG: crossover junction endodeoxyribonuclease RuvC [Desulfobulbaceae bacterium]|nr:crossover junction endodeoxyribonuclease RuvC [Desulfobulbaceae bacterium]